MNGEITEILRKTEFTFIALVNNGKTRIGILGMAAKQSAHPEFIDRANLALSILDDDDFDDAVSALFK